uniref:Uncharacterized protein n=1 Tax=Coccolithus braarudii TaxID=221442 RepID=A0A7S0Q0E7_9EUKA
MRARLQRTPLAACLAACFGSAPPKQQLPSALPECKRLRPSTQDKDTAATCIALAWRKHSSGRSTTPTGEEQPRGREHALSSTEQRQLEALLGCEVDGAMSKQLLSDGSVARRQRAIRRRFDEKMQGKTQQQRRVIARSLFSVEAKSDSSDVDSIADDSELVASPIASAEAFPIPQYIEAPSPRTPANAGFGKSPTVALLREGPQRASPQMEPSSELMNPFPVQVSFRETACSWS